MTSPIFTITKVLSYLILSLFNAHSFFLLPGFCGMKWDKANKSIEFVVSSIQNSLEEHLSFVLQKANVLCLKLVGLLSVTNLLDFALFFCLCADWCHFKDYVQVDLEGVDMEVVTNVLRFSKARVSHLQLVINRTMSTEIVSVIDATGTFVSAQFQRFLLSSKLWY